MRFTRDRRGQSVVVGTVILFGFLILALASYQAFAVPAQNNQAEFEHSQDVQSDMEDLRASLLDVRDARQDPYQRPVRVSLGTRYNSRLFTVNPPRPEGSLTTQDRGNLSISGANVVNQDFDNTEPLFDREHRTRLLTYRPNYNEYRNPPRTTFEHSLLYNRFEGANRTVTGQRTIDGDDRQLSLVAYSNDINRQGLSTTIDPETIDGPTPTIPIEGDDGTFTVTLPTHSPSVWTDLIGNTTDTGELNARVVDNTTQSVTVELEGEWNLQMARVGYEGRTVDKTPFSNVTRIDIDDPDTNRFDIKWTESDPTNIEEGSTVPLDILVSDRISDEPITGAGVNASVAPRGDVSGFPSTSDPPETDTDGQTVVDFDANEAEAGDSFDLFAVAGDDIDQIRVDIIESGTLLRLFPDDFSETVGSLENFENMQNDDGAVAEFRGSSPNSFNIETFTRDVPTGEYALELGIGEIDLQGNSNGISVTVEDADGTELASTTIDDDDENSAITFNVGSINPEQDITVRYEADQQNDDLDVDYQRLVRFQE